jgi:hypothetical protein
MAELQHKKDAAEISVITGKWLRSSLLIPNLKK